MLNVELLKNHPNRNEIVRFMNMEFSNVDYYNKTVDEKLREAFGDNLSFLKKEYLKLFGMSE
jgi:hypothetical protein